MADRLQELLHQRHLLEGHLAWLDRQIAEAHAARGSQVSPPPSSGPLSPPSATSLASNVDAVAEPEALLDSYEQDPRDLAANTKRGCLIYFAAMMLLLGIIVGVFYIRTVRRAQSEPEQNAAPVEVR